jgi:hypothetical protein
MKRKKEFSKCCVKCNVEWLPDMSNKYKKRALCLECHKIYYNERKAVYTEKHKDDKRRIDLMQPFKLDNRKEHWKKVNDGLKGLKDINEIHAYIKERADEIFANKELMEYINHQSL